MYFSRNSESHSMKRVLYLLSIFTLLSAFTCEDEPLDQDILDNVDPNNPDNVACIGQWELVSLDYEGTSTTTAAGTTTTSSYTGTSLNEDYILILEDDGTYSAQGSYDIELNKFAMICLEMETSVVTMKMENDDLKEISNNMEIEGNNQGAHNKNSNIFPSANEVSSASEDNEEDDQSEEQWWALNFPSKQTKILFLKRRCS